MSEPILSPEDADLLAAEYALGLLDEADAAAAMRRELTDPSFARQVAAWRERTAGWAAELPSEPVPDSLVRRVRHAIAREDNPRMRMHRRASPRHHARWRVLALAMTGTSLALAVTLALVTVRGPEQPRVIPRAETSLAVAQISDSKGAPLVSAVYRPEASTLSVRSADLRTAEKAPELWVLDAAGKPHSLGLLASDGIATVKLTARMRTLLKDKAVIAITIEDRASAPHDAPTGDILGTAQLSDL